MKKCIIIACCILLLNDTFSQSPYYDAITLSGYIEAGTDPIRFIIPGETKDSVFQKERMKEYCKIINSYFGNKFSNSKEIHQHVGLYTINNKPNPEYNPFIGPLLSPGEVQFNKNGETFSERKSLSFSSIGGLDVTNIADGFAKFLVKRTKEELNVAFFSKFKEEISKDEYKDLQTVFPQTYRTLKIIGDEIYNYEAYIQILRDSFENDLASLNSNLPSIISNHLEFFKKFPELEATLQSGCYIAGELRDKVHPGDILKDYPPEYLDSLKPNWKGAIQTMQLISASLRDTSLSDTVYWVNSKQIKKLVKDSIAFKIYLGLIYQQAIHDYDSIKFQKTSLIKILKTTAKNHEPYKKYITRFGEKTEKLNSIIHKYAKPVNDSLAFEHYAAYFKASIDLLQYSTEAGKLPGVDLPRLADSLKNYFDVAQTSCDLVLAINRRNYGGAVTDAVHIYDIIRPKLILSNDSNKKELNKKELDTQINNFNKEKNEIEKNLTYLKNQITDANNIKQINNANYTSIQGKLVSLKTELTKKEKKDKDLNDTLAILNLKKDILVSPELFHKFFKYGTFMATIVQAKNSDDVEKAIEAAAMPSGSSRIKRETPFNVSLNAYTGLFLGHEKISGIKDNHLFNSYGLSAPIGVSISTGTRKFFGTPCNREGHWSYSAFISLVDIGSVAAFRFQNNDSVSQVPTIKLQDIFSPGLFISVGIPKCPLSFNLGAQVGPNLRKVYVEDSNNPGKYINSYQDNIYWRISGSILVDIPLLNFYTKSK